MPLRIGLVGAGMIGGTHSAVLQQIARLQPDRVELVAVADPLASHREFFQQVYGYRAAYESAADLLRDADIDALFVCTPTRDHAELVYAAAERRLHIFCEKPLAMSYAEGRRMVDAADAAGCKTQIGLVLRYSAVYSVMRSLLEQPEAGTPMAVVFRDDQCFPIRGLHNSAWRADPSLTAGGTLIEHGVHDLDLLVHLFGPMTRVRAWERNFAGHAGVEDYLAAEIEFEGGLRAQLVNVWHNVLQRHSNRRVEIFCGNAFVASEHDMAGEITVQFGEESERVLKTDEVMQRFLNQRGASEHPLRDWFGAAYFVQDLAFVDAILEGRDPSPSLADGLEAQRLAEAVYHAARTGMEVDVAAFAPAAAPSSQL